jgi:hypothetical protein
VAAVGRVDLVVGRRRQEILPHGVAEVCGVVVVEALGVAIGGEQRPPVAHALGAGDFDGVEIAIALRGRWSSC